MPQDHAMTRKNKQPRPPLFPSRDLLIDNSPFFFENGEPTRAPTVVTVQPEARHTFGQDSASSQHTALMRARLDRKRDRPEIVEAIIAVHGHNNPDPHRYKTAATILPKVNAWLEERGYKPVLVDALARRIPHTYERGISAYLRTRNIIDRILKYAQILHSTLFTIAQRGVSPA
jgi:hypothetical protein